MFYELKVVVEKIEKGVVGLALTVRSPADASRRQVHQTTIKIQEQIWWSYIMRLAFIDKYEVNGRFVRLGY